jgi:hypothetical protein
LGCIGRLYCTTGSNKCSKKPLQEKRNYIKMSGTKISKSIIVNVGLCQGCGLLPVLFKIHINKIIGLWEMTDPKGIKFVGDSQLTHLMYADGKVLLAPTEDGLQRAIVGLNYTVKARYRK